MTTTHPEASRNDVRTPATVAETEAAWLVAIHERERFLGYDGSMGATVEAETSEVTCRERGGRATVTCFQKMRIRRLPDLPPIMQLSRRQPSA
ncbi:hypothetical protein [Streptomyces sp. Root369]|uniref:hypothetical protein n=1 Tax=Streptomyces sp. Root369 TaxID=1736523 RepID=UPI00070C55D0|nr:hypothetical protein [Streptomyces sp. Root369]KQW03824.1 hypothetical protein ASD08_43000 [Streptomyces sp. Root369]